MCGNHYGPYDRLKYLRQSKYGQDPQHQFQFCRDPSEGALRAVCSCGWSAATHDEDLWDDPLEALLVVVGGHLTEEEAKKKAFQRKLDVDPLPYKSGLREEWLP